jgi:hypothetical protein
MSTHYGGGPRPAWPLPMDGERRQTFEPITQHLPRVELSDDDIGPHENDLADMARLQVLPVIPRHRAGDDLPGPSRRELARMLRQVRALALVCAAGSLGALAGVVGMIVGIWRL